MSTSPRSRKIRQTAWAISLLLHLTIILLASCYSILPIASRYAWLTEARRPLPRSPWQTLPTQYQLAWHVLKKHAARNPTQGWPGGGRCFRESLPEDTLPAQEALVAKPDHKLRRSGPTSLLTDAFVPLPRPLRPRPVLVIPRYRSSHQGYRPHCQWSPDKRKIRTQPPVLQDKVPAVRSDRMAKCSDNQQRPDTAQASATAQPAGRTAHVQKACPTSSHADVRPAGKGKLQGPLLLYSPNPKYPQRALRLGWQGRVLLAVEILASGVTGRIQVRISSGYPTLDQAAISTLQQWRFKPAQRNGVAIVSWLEIPLVFQLP